jgi:NAD-dependent DNA ligase
LTRPPPARRARDPPRSSEAVDPEITFGDRTFVFTGESERGSREHLEDHVLRRGGTTSSRVTRDTDYLIVCAQGSAYWAFAAYGRKVEYAYKLRKQGHKVVLVHEADFWDALN